MRSVRPDSPDSTSVQPQGTKPGVIVTDATKPSEASNGFGFFWPVTLKLDNDKHEEGFVVQRIDVSYKAWKVGDSTDATGVLTFLPKSSYLEAWYVWANNFNIAPKHQAHPIPLKANDQLFNTLMLSQGEQTAYATVGVTLPPKPRPGRTTIQWNDSFALAVVDKDAKELSDNQIRKVELTITGTLIFMAKPAQILRNNTFVTTNRFGAGNNIFSTDQVTPFDGWAADTPKTEHKLTATWDQESNKTTVTTKTGPIRK